VRADDRLKGAALDEKRLRVIGLAQPPGAVQVAALGRPEYGEAPI
jgi:hypothetical protein